MKDKSILEMYLEDMKEIKPLEESELDTLKKALLSGDNSAKNRIIEGHMIYTTELIQPFVGCGQEITDLISESHLALTMAVAEYKSGDLKAQIRTAVEKRLNEIIDEETKVKNASNMLAERLNDLMEASRILAQEYGREASVEELSDRLMVPKDEVEELLKISLNAMDPGKKYLEYGEAYGREKKFDCRSVGRAYSGY